MKKVMNFVTGSSKKGKEKKRARTDSGGSSAEAFQPVPIQVEIPSQGGQSFGEYYYGDQPFNPNPQPEVNEDEQEDEHFDEEFEDVFPEPEPHPEQQGDPPSFPNRHDIYFATNVEYARYLSYDSKPIYNSKFLKTGVLKALHMQTEVTRLFKNIGWEKLLTLKPRKGYIRPTLEFLSTLTGSHRHGRISFRAYGVPHHVTIDTISSPVHTATRGMFCFDSDVHDFTPRSFWRTIAHDDPYDAGKAKASRIIHPVLKMADRILASLLFPGQNPGVCSKGRLELLYLMTRDNHPDRPHFGARVVKTLLSVKNSRQKQIHMASLVSLVLETAGVQIDANNEAAARGDVHLDIENLVYMGLIRTVTHGHTWCVLPRQGTPDNTAVEYLRVTAANKSVLSLKKKIAETNWLPSSNITPGAGSSSQAAPTARLQRSRTTRQVTPPTSPQHSRHSTSHHSGSQHSFHEEPRGAPDFVSARHSSAAIPSYFTDYQAVQQARWDGLHTYQAQRDAYHAGQYQQQDQRHAAHEREMEQLTQQFRERSLYEHRMEHMVSHIFNHPMFAPHPPLPPYPPYDREQ